MGVIGTLVEADFDKGTMTFKVNGPDMSVQAGDYVIKSIKEHNQDEAKKVLEAFQSLSGEHLEEDVDCDCNCMGMCHGVCEKEPEEDAYWKAEYEQLEFISTLQLETIKALQETLYTACKKLKELGGES